MKIIECPRDAMQGLPEFISTSDKINYINQLLKVGFDAIDFGSFVSPKAIPQLRDTAEVYDGLHWRESSSRLLAIVANVRGAQQAVTFEGITYLGFPMSISETFQQRNTNSSITDALETLREMKELCSNNKKKLVTYISMGFGNPYGDPYEPEIVSRFVDILVTLGADVISLADTVGVATPEAIGTLFTSLSTDYPDVEIGVHLHATPQDARAKIDAAYRAGCKRFDGAIKGYGGCPMAEDELVGNIDTETLLNYLESAGEKTGLDMAAFAQANVIAAKIFPNH